LAIPALLDRQIVGGTQPVPSPQTFGFEPHGGFTNMSEAAAMLRLRTFLSRDGAAWGYEENRNFPAIAGTSRLSPALRAGTIGIRTCVEAAFARLNSASGAHATGVRTWISELIWRDFYQMILRRFPHVAGEPFNRNARRIAWLSTPQHFEAWCRGKTGYPIVDAGMRQLNQDGWMHNRLRMITASFLSKDLLVDWQKGEKYFEQRLADADRAQNNGGWQWASSTGTDAAAYFRVFNPIVQGKRFDPRGEFVRRFVPELHRVPDEYVHEPWTIPPLLQQSLGCVIGRDYPAPIVDHARAAKRAISAYSAAFTQALS
jgi:deoxyribodipyrimidine photo-lyase